MADNVELDPGTGGAIIAADDIGPGVWYQRVKVNFGADGSATDVSSAAPLPVDLRADNLASALDVAVENAHSGDFDTGGGTDTTIAFGIAVPASGGAVVVPGDATSGLKVDLGADNDVTVTGSVTANAGTNLNTSALALESGGNLAGAATSLAILDDWDESDRAKVNPIAGQAGVQGGSGAVSALTQRVVLATDVALPAGTNNIGDVDIASIAAGDNNIGNVDIASALPAGTNNIGDVDVLTIAAGSNLIGDVGLSGARTSGGTTIFRSLDLDETEEEIKGSAGQVYWIHAMNRASTARYLKFYNATAASVTVGSTTPVLTFVIPTQGDTNGAGFVLSIPNGIAFSTAITAAATTGIADADTGAPSANDVVLNCGFA